MGNIITCLGAPDACEPMWMWIPGPTYWGATAGSFLRKDGSCVYFAGGWDHRTDHGPPRSSGSSTPRTSSAPSPSSIACSEVPGDRATRVDAGRTHDCSRLRTTGTAPGPGAGRRDHLAPHPRRPTLRRVDLGPGPTRRPDRPRQPAVRVDVPG